MTQTEFVDYYEILELSPNANTETIERIFRYMASRYHPDICGENSKKRFNQMVTAYNKLRDPVSRAKYDALHRKQQIAKAELINGSEAAGDDCVDRFRLLTLFYAQRRQDMRNPGVGTMKLSQILGCPMEVLEFHVWYFREKGWVGREENGLLAITAAGVDEIEERNKEHVTNDDRLLTYEGPPSAQPGVIKTGATTAAQPRPAQRQAPAPQTRQAQPRPVQPPVVPIPDSIPVQPPVSQPRQTPRTEQPLVRPIPDAIPAQPPVAPS